MGEYAGMLPRKFFSFHCLENDSNELKGSNTEGAQNYPDLPQRSESEFVVFEETETSPTKSLSMLQVAGGKGAMVGETEVTNKESVVVGCHECLLSSIDQGSEGLEKFLHDKLESFSSEGLDRIVEVDLNVVLGLLDEDSVDRGSAGNNVVAVDEEMPTSRVDDILLSELQEKGIGSVSKRLFWDVDVGAANERPSKSVAFQFDNAASRLSSGCELVGVSDAGQSFPSSSRPDDTDYGTSELESIARKRVGDVSERRVHEVTGMGGPFSSGTTVRHGLNSGCSKYYSSNSARTLLKECFVDNPPVRLDPHQQLTGMREDQMIQFARAIRLEVSLATFGILEDVLLKIGGKTGRNVGEKRSGQSSLFSRGGSTVMESVASGSFCSLSTFTESSGSCPSAGDLAQQPCSGRQADAALDFSRTEVAEIEDTDSLKTLGQIGFNARKKGNLYKWLRGGRLNPIASSGPDDGEYVFTEEMLELAPFAKIFATGTKNPLKNWHCFFCMICRRNVSMKFRGLYELKRQFQREHHLRADQRFRARYHPSKVPDSDGRTLYG